MIEWKMDLSFTLPKFNSFVILQSFVLLVFRSVSAMFGPFCNKVIALGGMFWISLNTGYVFGQMTGVISALQKQDEGILLSESQISLIASSFTMVCLIGFWTAALVADKVGRRWSFVLFSILLLINWIILYIATDMLTFILSRIIGGVGSGALISLCICVPSEYLPSISREFYLNMITTVAPAMGTGFGHFAGVTMHWRNAIFIGMVSTLIGIILPYFWVESPHWLASRGMFAECAESFKKIHGKKNDKELRVLIKLETCKQDAAYKLDPKNTYRRLLVAFKRKYFWELMVLTATIYAYLAASGKLVFSSLATVMLEEMTGNSDVLVFTLLIDCFILVGSVLSCVLIRKMSMRTLLFTTGFTANAVLVILSACLYFKTNKVYFQWINVSLLALFFIMINAGPYPVAEAMMSEVFPLELKFYCFFFSGITWIVFLTLSIMLFPLIVSSMGYHGMFLLNAAAMSASLGYIWIKLPETKGKTLQEIEVYFKTKDFNVDEVLSNVQMKPLI